MNQPSANRFRWLNRAMLVIGGRDLEARAVSVRLHHGGPQGAKPKGEVVADTIAKIEERRAQSERSSASRCLED